MITFNKPCSVLDNHLSALACPANHFISLLQVPLPNLGFSLMGFIAFHFHISVKLVSLTLLQAPSMDHSLGIVPAVSLRCPGLSFDLA